MSGNLDLVGKWRYEFCGLSLERRIFDCNGGFLTGNCEFVCCERKIEWEWVIISSFWVIISKYLGFVGGVCVFFFFIKTSMFKLSLSVVSLV